MGRGGARLGSFVGRLLLGGGAAGALWLARRRRVDGIRGAERSEWAAHALLGATGAALLPLRGSSPLGGIARGLGASLALLYAARRTVAYLYGVPRRHVVIRPANLATHLAWGIAVGLLGRFGARRMRARARQLPAELRRPGPPVLPRGVQVPFGRVDEAGAESFPASDPPSWSPTHIS